MSALKNQNDITLLSMQIEEDIRFLFLEMKKTTFWPSMFLERASTTGDACIALLYLEKQGKLSATYRIRSLVSDSVLHSCGTADLLSMEAVYRQLIASRPHDPPDSLIEVEFQLNSVYQQTLEKYYVQR